MAREFRLPDIGEGLTEAEIVRWLVPEGEHVDADQAIVEVETDKAVVEIPSPYAGTVVKHGGAEGETLQVGAVLVVIGDEEEEPKSVPEPVTVETGDSDQTQGSAFQEPSELASVAPIVGTISEEAEILSPPSAGPAGSGSGVKALPVVRKLARDKGIDLTLVAGSGPGGRITREDVLAAAVEREPEQPAASPQAAPTEESEEAVSSPAEPESQPMSRLRRTIAANMSRSWSEIPHVTTFDDVDATRLLEVRTALGSRHQKKIPIEALVVRAVLPALDSYPEFNASLDGDDLVLHPNRDIGIAVDTPDGLLVAVIQDAESKSVLELADEVARLGAGAKDRALGPSELTGQTFTISNIGAVGGGHGTPIVPHGTTAILSVGRARDRVIVIDGDLVIAPVMPLSLSYDHRVIDGGQGRRFMAQVMENLEEPALFLAS